MLSNVDPSPHHPLLLLLIKKIIYYINIKNQFIYATTPIFFFFKMGDLIYLLIIFKIKSQDLPTMTDQAQGDPMQRCVRKAGKTINQRFLKDGSAR